MTRGKRADVGWTEERVYHIRGILGADWIRPGIAAIVLGVHRGTVNNYMSDGRLTWSRSGGRKLRSVLTVDVLQMVLAEVTRDEQAGCDMGHCSSSLVEEIRRTVEANERRTNGERTNAANGEQGG